MIDKLEFRFSYTHSEVQGSIYNPTDFRLSNVVVRIQAPADDARESLDRLYALNGSAAPLAEGSYRTYAGFAQELDDRELAFTLEKVFVHRHQ